VKINNNDDKDSRVADNGSDGSDLDVSTLCLYYDNLDIAGSTKWGVLHTTSLCDVPVAPQLDIKYVLMLGVAMRLFPPDLIPQHICAVWYHCCH
jgi:hypothetical protein